MQSYTKKTNYWNRKVEYQGKNTAQKILGIIKKPTAKTVNTGCGPCGPTSCSWDEGDTRR